MFNILFAEDDANLRDVVTKTLQNAGYTVTAAADGKAAYEAFCAEPFDLVITDIMMPFMDGNQLTAEIRKLSEDMPVLMLTALETIDDKEKGFTSSLDEPKGGGVWNAEISDSCHRRHCSRYHHGGSDPCENQEEIDGGTIYGSGEE